MKKFDDLKIISIVLLTFGVAIGTSLLLEIEIFRNPVRYFLVCMLILVELVFGYVIFKKFLSKY
ncbi:hypothetical protein BTO06_01045 [Tenacibaculum sp. SZ-18]|uniref:hypothetical protein n=1 Tax=Tenacibaculum sp. SZ-18 TaxID=754423 RepID=UPI000C2D632C|nr:hypothetical protein [Tenacibaculum sp. SZ-18]AUC13820.1 hypothetical protein BTO06_01045 [Tenacibaculum sp. SZ-18]